jgi:hypothetical protein
MIKIIYILLLSSLFFGKQVINEFMLDITSNYNYSFKISSTIKYNNLSIAILEPLGFIIFIENPNVNILGYSFENEFNVNKISKGLEFKLNQYSQQFNHIYLNQIQTSSNRDVNPLITAQWDQGSPFNGMCPTGPPGTSTGPAIVGCVAVGMAQVMHYWQYPPTGVGNISYYDSNYGTIEVDFSNAFYDYTDMSDTYGNEEVQELLFHCGASVEMDYGPDGSGAAGGPFSPSDYPSAFSALQEHFGYQSSMQFLEKNNYSDEIWFSLIKEELDNGRPVIYDACASVGCHTWNVDGYQGDYIHCNWGWGGDGNGYYLLNTLNPEPGLNFNDDVWAIIGIEPGSLVLLGDVNNDGNINVQDIILSINIILGNSSFLQSADINSDNVVDVLDIVLLVNLILGISIQ